MTKQYLQNGEKAFNGSVDKVENCLNGLSIWFMCELFTVTTIIAIWNVFVRQHNTMFIESFGAKRIGHCITKIMVESAGPSLDLSANLFTATNRSKAGFDVQIDGASSADMCCRWGTNVNARRKECPIKNINYYFRENKTNNAGW